MTTSGAYLCETAAHSAYEQEHEVARPTHNQVALIAGLAVALACVAAGRKPEFLAAGLLLGTITAGVIYRDDSRPDWRVVEAREIAATRSQISGLVALVAGKASEAVPYVKAAPPLIAPGESLLLVVSTSLWLREHVGYTLDSATLGVNAAKPNAIGSLTLGGSASVTKGVAQRIDGFMCVDTGTLTLTTKRLLYVGESRAAEVDLGRILEVRAQHGLIDVAHHDRQHQERFAVEHADLIANLIDVSAQRCQLVKAYN